MDEEKIDPALIKKLYEKGKYKTLTTGTPTHLREIVHSAVANMGMPVSWVAQNPEEIRKNYPEIFERVNKLMPDTTAEEKRARVSEWSWVDESLDLKSDNFPPNRKKFAEMIIELCAFFSDDDEVSKFYREHLREVATTLELGIDKKLENLDEKFAKYRKTGTHEQISQEAFDELHKNNVPTDTHMPVSRYFLLDRAAGSILRAASRFSDKWNALENESQAYKDYIRPLTPKATKQLVLDIKRTIRGYGPDKDLSELPPKEDLKIALSHLKHLTADWHDEKTQWAVNSVDSIFELLDLGKAESAEKLQSHYIKQVSDPLSTEEMDAYGAVELPNKRFENGRVETSAPISLEFIYHTHIAPFGGLESRMQSGVFKEGATQDQIRTVHEEVRNVMISQLESACTKKRMEVGYDAVSKADIQTVLPKLYHLINPDHEYGKYLRQVIAQTYIVFHMDKASLQSPKEEINQTIRERVAAKLYRIYPEDFTKYKKNMLFDLNNLAQFSMSAGGYEHEPKDEYIAFLKPEYRNEAGRKKAIAIAEELRVMVQDTFMQNGDSVLAKDFARIIDSIAELLAPDTEHYKHTMKYIEDARNVIAGEQSFVQRVEENGKSPGARHA